MLTDYHFFERLPKRQNEGPMPKLFITEQTHGNLESICFVS